MSYRFLARLARGAHVAFGLFMVFALIAPLITAVPISFSAGSFLSYPLPGFSLQWYEKVFLAGPWLDALWNSLIVGVLSTLIATPLGTLAAFAFARGGLPMPTTLLGILIAPMIVPPVITGLGLYFALAEIGLTSTLAGVVIAHAVLAAPFVLITVSATLQGFDFRLLRAAASLGASPVRAFFNVLVPLMAPGIISGALFAFATSFDEVVVTLFIAGPAQRTMPLKMFEGIRDNIDPSILAMASFLMCVAIVTLASASLLMKNRSKRMNSDE
ncbi:ABC transporter permease [Ancylobacter sp.]|uniref:ABC transporter permease n=1 Tax=Ancylobacter sp. TaxID=1872567 RepID=UPI003C7CA1B1